MKLEHYKAKKEQLQFIIEEKRDKIREIEREINSKMEEVNELTAEFAQENAPYKVGDRILVKWSERKGGLFSGEKIEKEYEVEIYKVLVRLRAKEPFVEFEYKARPIKADGTVSKQRFKAGAFITEFHIVKKIEKK